jgi:hypothetical protein
MSFMRPVRYRWDAYGPRSKTTAWRSLGPPGGPYNGRLRYACSTIKGPNERLRIEFDNGQQVVVRRRFK